MSKAFSCRRKSAFSASLLAAGLCLLLTGCVIKVNKHEKNGQKHDNVSVVTPFGGVHVQSNQTTAANLGLPVYPGAVPTTSNGNDGSANVDMGFGPWRMHVQVVTYKTSDPQSKVIAFYRKALGQYGTVIACNGDKPAGKPTSTGQGLTCHEKYEYIGVNGSNKTPGVNMSVNGGNISPGFNLRAGSRRHQRIVAFQDTGGHGAKFTLLELEFPRSTSKHSTPD